MSLEDPVPASVMVFDADGVLIHPWRFADYLLREFGLTREMTREFFGGVFVECYLGRADLREVLPPFLPKWGWKGSLDAFLDVWFRTDGVVDERMIAAVRSLRRAGFLCCLATTQEKHRARYLTETLGFGELFDHLFFSHAAGHAKPDPAFYEHVERCLGVTGRDILFWDDAEANIQAARQRDWQAHLYTTFDDFAAKMGSCLGDPPLDACDVLGLPRGCVEVVPYQPAWASLFEREARCIRQACGAAVVALEHIGSTAVPGLPAKPILDIMPGLAHHEDGQQTIEPITRLGYEYLGEHGIAGRYFFVKRRGDLSLVHLHMYEVGHPEWRQHLRFRDHLRGDRRAAAEYAALKQRLAEQHPRDRVAYTDAKAAFIQAILARADRAC